MTVIDIGEYRKNKTGNEYGCYKCGKEVPHRGDIVFSSSYFDYSYGEPEPRTGYLCYECSGIRENTRV
jgi:hypothetical protein